MLYYYNSNILGAKHKGKLMTKKLLAVFTTMLLFGFVYSSTHVYIEELNNFKNSPDYQLIFKDNQDTHPLLQVTERNLVNYKQLSSLQRLIYSAFLALDTIVITPDTMPQLYAFIDDICAKAKIKTPVVFLTREKGFFNAAAQKLLMSTGAVVIGQKLLLETSQEELEAVICHEIGHLKHNHSNKHTAIALSTLLVAGASSYYLSKQALGRADIDPALEWMRPLLQLMPYVVAGKIASLAVALIPPFIINKRFEKEADEFAKTMGKSAGLIAFFKRLQAKQASLDHDFEHTRGMLDANKNNLSWSDYLELSASYYLTKWHNKAYTWLYYNTSLGQHPSPEARIQEVQDYVASQPHAVPAA